MQVELINNQNRIKFDLQIIKEAAAYISDKFDPDKNKSLNVVFLSDAGIKKLNKSYRNIDRSTDVLSFSYLGDTIDYGKSGRSCVIGEIYISPGTAQKNSAAQGKDWSLELEIILLIIHGLLHIYGYDHEEDEDKAVMYNIQDSLVHDIRSRNWNRY
jgi:probable rRNA maturation factor